MPCTHPFHAFPTGYKTESGKDEYFFDTSRSSFIPAWQVEKRFGGPDRHYIRDLHEFIEVPCGHCMGCKRDYAHAWAFRCLAEMQDHEGPAWFVTLTYGDWSLPEDRKVSPQRLQSWFWHLRNQGYKFRYFATGEYGEMTNRPHYHVLFFGLKLDESKFVRWGGNRFPLYECEELQKTWPEGRLLVSRGVPEYVGGYIAKYIVKDMEEENGKKKFVRMSLHPGLGFRWIEENIPPMVGILNGTVRQRVKLGNGRGSIVSATLPRAIVEKKKLEKSTAGPKLSALMLANMMHAAGYSVRDLSSQRFIDEFRENQEYLMQARQVMHKLMMK